MAKTRKPRRSAEEIIAEQKAKLASREAKLALKTAKNRPELRPILASIETVSGIVNCAKAGFSNSPQSFKNRLTSHKLWIDEILATEKLAKANLEDAQDILRSLKANLESAVLALVNGEEIDSEGLSEYTLEGFDELKDNWLRAQNARKEFLAQKKAPKRKAKEATTE